MIYLDLHTHTVVSGHAYSTLNENIAAAREHGLTIYGVSDHTPKMPGSTHLFYFRNLHVVPEFVQGIRVLKGAELNVMDVEGHVDLDESTLKMLDYAIASLHVPCFGTAHTEAENTQAMINAVQDPYVKILGHPDDSRAYPIDQGAVVLGMQGDPYVSRGQQFLDESEKLAGRRPGKYAWDAAVLQAARRAGPVWQRRALLRRDRPVPAVWRKSAPPRSFQHR